MSQELIENIKIKEMKRQKKIKKTILEENMGGPLRATPNYQS